MKDISEEADECDPDTSLSKDLRIFWIQGSGFVNGLHIPTTQCHIITYASQDSSNCIHPSQRVSNTSLQPAYLCQHDRQCVCECIPLGTLLKILSVCCQCSSLQSAMWVKIKLFWLFYIIRVDCFGYI